MHDARTYAQCPELDKYVCALENSYVIVAFAKTFASALFFPLIPTGFSGKRGVSMASDDFPTTPKQFFDYAKKQQAEMVDVKFVDKLDLNFNPLGSRGIGEIGITGVAGALSNAVFHATGRRIRDLPITPEKLLS